MEERGCKTDPLTFADCLAARPRRRHDGRKAVGDNAHPLSIGMDAVRLVVTAIQSHPFQQEGIGRNIFLARQVREDPVQLGGVGAVLRRRLHTRDQAACRSPPAGTSDV